MARRITSNVKKALEAREQELLNDINYYQNRIEEAKSVKNSSSYYESDSSDSELEFTINTSPSITHLKLHHSMLKTCFQATQELTDVVVIQSEVNVLTEDPVIEGEPPITQPGLWRQIMAECRIDLVPFSITFYAHKESNLFGLISYRALQVLPVKKAHEAELAHSELATLRQPSQAIEVIRSYAVAYRSRRTTLAKLAQKYADSLFMEPMPDGGYVLKCANILQISWILQSKSYIAPFNHKMKFDLEYIDESYIKIITQAHRQLSDPTISTDERTLLLSKIINTCLEAQKTTQDLRESLQSDPESLDRSRSRTLDMDMDAPDTDAQIMAPPKYVPKNKALDKMPKNKSVPKNMSPPDTLCDNNAPKLLPPNGAPAKSLSANKPKLSENKSQPKKLSENKAPTKPVSENRAPSKPVSGNKAPSKPVSENKAPSKPVSENKAPSKPVSENKAPSKILQENKTQSKKLSENKAPSKTVSENKASSKTAEKASSKTIFEKKTTKTLSENKAQSNKLSENKTPSKIVKNKVSSKTISENRDTKTLPEKEAPSKILSVNKAPSKKIAENKAQTKPSSENKDPSKTASETMVASKKMATTAPKTTNAVLSEPKRKKTALPMPVLKNKFPFKTLSAKKSPKRLSAGSLSKTLSANKAPVKRSSSNRSLTEPVPKKKALPVPVFKNNPPYSSLSANKKPKPKIV